MGDMKRLTVMLLVALAVGALLAACRPGPVADPGAGPDESGDASGAVIGHQPVGEELVWVEGRTGEAGVYVKKFGDHRLVLVAMGERPTAGYGVVVDGVAVSEDGWVIDVRFVEPGPGDIVAQVITYPYEVVRIADDGRGVTVRDVTGEEPVELAVTVE
ncbi:MAG TPA: hypothetical protein DHW14_01815 [Clostridiales bacterium]|nr:hypothetical protein [Clostridiales bacterium]